MTTAIRSRGGGGGGGDDDDSSRRHEKDADTLEHALLVVRACVRLIRTLGGALVGGSGASAT